MKVLEDYRGRKIRLTDERLNHIREHPEIVGMLNEISRTLADPQEVVQSLGDPEAHLYYRFYFGTRVGDKYFCVVVKVMGEDAFVLTAYLTDTIKKGEVLWHKKS